MRWSELPENIYPTASNNMPIDLPTLSINELLQKLVELGVLLPDYQAETERKLKIILDVAAIGMVRRGYIDKLEHLTILKQISAHMNHLG